MSSPLFRVEAHGLAGSGHHPFDDGLLQGAYDDDYVPLAGLSRQLGGKHPVPVVVGGLHGDAVHGDDPAEKGEHHCHKGHGGHNGLSPLQGGADPRGGLRGLLRLGARGFSICLSSSLAAGLFLSYWTGPMFWKGNRWNTALPKMFRVSTMPTSW